MKKTIILRRIGSYFFKVFMVTIFKNIKTIILVFYENCSYYLNLAFSIFSIVK